MIAARSALFNIAFYLNLIVQMIVLTPFYFLLPRKLSWIIPKAWSKSSNWLLKVIVGTTFEVEGRENLPEGGYIVAPKHQSFWDVYTLLPLIPDPFFILKRELMWIPLFGLYVLKQRMVPVNRAARGRAMAAVMQRAKDEMNTGRQLIIYPEGTRRPPGAPPEYKYGVARLYRDLGVPVVPVVVHAGLFWPRRSLRRYPGHFKVRFLPPIAPGLSPDVFFEELVRVTEAASDRLLLEAARDNPDLPLPPSAVARIAALTAAGDPA
ncbi:lysophospholipid acyltransferase family protein [Ensifer soli]|uniref:lysophospholipid acyltransferase family protein n=1 Tax=Ciceribacter sp. sgz301302 TaxID=3342379 RepID=UPI0035BB47D1